MTQNNIDKIKNRIANIEKTALKFVFVYITLAFLGLFIPMGFLPKAGRKVRGNFSQTLPELIGVSNYLIVTILIIVLIIGIILILYKYFDLKKDLKNQTKLTFATTFDKIVVLNNDLGEMIYRIWLSTNPYNIKKIEVNSDTIIESDLAIGALADIIISSNAYFPLDIIIRKNNTSVNKKSIKNIIKNLSNTS